VGGFNSLALASNGTVWAWGDNLGNGTNTPSNIPVQVSLPSGVTITNIAAGLDYSLALASNGKVWAWGDNIWGELGNGTYAFYCNIPVQVSLPSGVVVKDIAAGYYHSLALVASATPITTTTSISGGSASVSQNDGVTVSITGSTAPNGTGVTIIRLAVLPLLRSLVPMPALPTLSSKELLPGL